MSLIQFLISEIDALLAFRISTVQISTKFVTYMYFICLWNLLFSDKLFNE